MNKIFKIYKIQFPNGKVYIGQTYNVHKRWLEHLYEACSGNQLKVYKAMRKYHIKYENFSIIEDNIFTQEEANQKEIYYIKIYDSQNNGYNIGSGGVNGWQPHGENHPKSILTDNELLELRKLRYSKQYSMNELYEFYKDRITYSGFEKYWNYESRPEVGNEFNTKELKQFYKTFKENIKGENHVHSKLTNEQVLYLRMSYFQDGIKIKVLWENFKNLYSLSGFRKIILGKTYTNVPMPNKTEMCAKKQEWLTKEEVLFIRQKYDSGMKVMEILRKWFPNKGENTILNAAKRKTYTNY